jgi:hypothetical protein
MHSHNEGLSYSMNGGKIQTTGKDGESRVFEIRGGEVSWGVETHEVGHIPRQGLSLTSSISNSEKVGNSKSQTQGAGNDSRRDEAPIRD